MSEYILFLCDLCAEFPKGQQNRHEEAYSGFSTALFCLLKYYLKADYCIVILSDIPAGQIPDGLISKGQKGFEAIA